MMFRARHIAGAGIAAVFISSCVVREGGPATNSPNSPPPPPPPPAPSAPTTEPQSTTPTPAPPATTRGPVLKETPSQGNAPPPDPSDPPASTTPLPEQPKQEPPPPPRVKPTQLPAGVANGQPKPNPAKRPILWIWRSRPGIWNVRTTTGAEQHVFWGAISGVNGLVSGVRVNRTELGDRVYLRGGAAAFLFATKGDMDGFGLSMTTDTCVRFELTVDSKPAPEIYVGERSVKAPSNHIILCP